MVEDEHPTVIQSGVTGDTFSAHADNQDNQLVRPSTSGNLLNIEHQRRMELLARKAAQESRRNKQTRTPQNGGVLQSFSISRNESVDDFLKSIGPVSSNSPYGPTTMDVDEPILFTDSPRNSAEPPPSSAADIQPTSATSSISIFSPTTSASATTQSPSPSIAIQSSGVIAVTDILRNGSTNLPIESSPMQRRLPKRPVASDFVDLDPTPQSGSVTPSAQQSVLRKPRPFNSFAALSTMRRCVIDISDSEDDEDESSSTTEFDRLSTMRRLTLRPSPSSNVGPPRLQKDTPTAVSTTRTTVPSPAMLAEKEREIQRMRELIAKREQKRAAVCLFVLSSSRFHQLNVCYT